MTSIPASRMAQLEQLCRDAGAGTLYAFGSRAREALQWLRGDREAFPSGPSDLDVGVLPAPDRLWTVREKVRFAIALEDLFGCNRVDLVLLPEADPFVAAEVVRGECLFTADLKRSDEYELYVLRRAGDLAPLEKERQELILQRFR